MICYETDPVTGKKKVVPCEFASTWYFVGFIAIIIGITLLIAFISS